MKERSIALSSFAVGLAALGLVAVIQTHPLALTGGAPRVQELDLPVRAPDIAPVWSAALEEAAPAVESSGVLQLPPVYITPASASSAEQEERALEPCSLWREMGPKYVTDGVPSGTQRVRDLC